MSLVGVSRFFVWVRARDRYTHVPRSAGRPPRDHSVRPVAGLGRAAWCRAVGPGRGLSAAGRPTESGRGIEATQNELEGESFRTVVDGRDPAHLVTRSSEITDATNWPCIDSSHMRRAYGCCRGGSQQACRREVGRVGRGHYPDRLDVAERRGRGQCRADWPRRSGRRWRVRQTPNAAPTRSRQDVVALPCTT
jgi:hypothetical protein